MTKSSNADLINKGVFALAVVAIVGVVGAVNFAQAAPNSNTAGYGNSGQAVSALARTFHDQNQENGREFSLLVRQIQAAYHSDNGNRQPVSTASTQPATEFDASFTAATNTFNATTDQAFEDFQVKVDSLANTAESKDQFIDQFNRAKADYLNELDVAKNAFADAVNRQGNNEGKDSFMNRYNQGRDAYSNKLEANKNEFAAGISNL